MAGSEKERSLPTINFQVRFVSFREGTPQNINIKTENDVLEDDFPLPGVYSQVPVVHLPGCKIRIYPVGFLA